MKKLVSLILFTVLFVTAFSGFADPKTYAAFNSNNLMADIVFEDSTAMSTSDIDSFLNSFSGSCISTNSGFEARVPNGYSPGGGFTFGDFTSAGQVVATSSQVYGINPRVLLATLQKEQSIVTGGGLNCNDGNENKYAAAMGYGCPDSGTTHSWTGVSLYRRSGVEHTTASSTCVSTSAAAGFSQQVIRGAWLLKFGEQRSKGNTTWAVVAGSWNNSDDPATCYGGPMTQGNRKRCSSDQNTVFYDGYTTIDGVSTHMDTGSTAALYWYTPHFSGNQHFYSIYSGWWGSPYITIPYAWLYAGQWAYSDAGRTQPFTSVPTVAPGSTIYVRVRAQNAGAQTWAQSSLHLGASRPNDRTSQFYDSSWLSSTRPAQMLESSVDSGDVATFEFSMKAPSAPGTYNEHFSVLAEGITWMNDLGQFFTINVNNSAAPSNTTATTLNSGETLHMDDYLLSPDAQSVLTLQRDGNVALYANFNLIWETATHGTSADHLTMQADGNLVVYSQAGQALWSSNTQGNPGARLVTQTDGNLVIYSASGVARWSTSTLHNPDHLSYINTTLAPGLGNYARLYPGQSIDTADRRFHLMLQRDGNLVLYSPTRALWATGTSDRQTAFLTLQSDGNMVLYDRSANPLWFSRTSGDRLMKLLVQQDGNLVLYDRFNTPFWNTNTAGSQ